MSITINKRERIFKRDGWECVSCESYEGLTIDHFIPASQGGSDAIDNLQTLCFYCNQRKGDTHPTEEEIKIHHKRIADLKKKKNVNWSKLKIPNIGMPDGLASYLKQNVKSKKFYVPLPVIKKKKDGILYNFPKYVKYVSFCHYAEYWIGGIEIGFTYRIEDFIDKQSHWGITLSIHKECWQVSTKRHWILSHGEEEEKVETGYVWSWERYRASVKERAERLINSEGDPTHRAAPFDTL